MPGVSRKAGPPQAGIPPIEAPTVSAPDRVYQASKDRQAAQTMTTALPGGWCQQPMVRKINNYMVGVGANARTTPLMIRGQNPWERRRCLTEIEPS